MKATKHKSMYFLVLVIYAYCLISGVPAAQASGTTYYVSQSSGNDNWDGLAESHDGTHGPWKTLAKASRNYHAGDSLLLKCGDTWSNDKLNPKGSGTPTNPITIASYGSGNKPILDGLDDTKDRMGIQIVDEGGYRIVGIEFTRYLSGIFAHFSVDKEPKQYLWIEDCYFHDSTFYTRYHDYLKNKPGLGIILWTDETKQRIVISDITIKNCHFERMLSGIWTNNPDNFNMAADGIYNFGNLVIEGCTSEEGKQWQLGLRGVDGGAVRNCVFHDTGRHFQSFNGVAGGATQRCRNMILEDSEWGFVSIGDRGKVSGDGQAFDFEIDCSQMIVRNCLFHDTDGPGFLLCWGASGTTPNRDILMENCVLNGKAMRVSENKFPKVEIHNVRGKSRVHWKNCRFYLSPGESLTDDRTGLTFTDCLVKKLGDACSTTNLALEAAPSASSNALSHEQAQATDGDITTSWKATSSNDQWLQLDFGKPQTINEFRIKEDASSSVIRYVIECWDGKASRWVGCFNGRTIGPDFIAPIVSRTTRKVRLLIKRTTSGNPCICEFEVYNDTTKGPPDPPPTGPLPTGMVNDSHDHIIYSDDEVTSEWAVYPSAPEIGGDEHYANVKGACCQFTFSGTGITWVGVKNLDHGEAEVYLDGVLQATVDTYNANRLSRQELFKKTGLPHGKHTFKIVVKGTKNAASTGYYVIVDAFKVDTISD